jgi:hypothetical protein
MLMILDNCAQYQWTRHSKGREQNGWNKKHTGLSPMDTTLNYGIIKFSPIYTDQALRRIYIKKDTMSNAFSINNGTSSTVSLPSDGRI